MAAPVTVLIDPDELARAKRIAEAGNMPASHEALLILLKALVTQ